MADSSYQNESLERAAAAKAKATWPAWLVSAAAVDTLARQLYVSRQEYFTEVVREWADVPHSIRGGFVELAERILKGLGEPPTSKINQDDHLWNLATSIARANDESRRTVVTGLRGKVIGAIGAAAAIDEVLADVLDARD